MEAEVGIEPAYTELQSVYFSATFSRIFNHLVRFWSLQKVAFSCRGAHCKSITCKNILADFDDCSTECEAQLESWKKIEGNP